MLFSHFHFSVHGIVNECISFDDTQFHSWRLHNHQPFKSIWDIRMTFVLGKCDYVHFVNYPTWLRSSELITIAAIPNEGAIFPSQTPISVPMSNKPFIPHTWIELHYKRSSSHTHTLGIGHGHYQRDNAKPINQIQLKTHYENNYS